MKTLSLHFARIAHQRYARLTVMNDARLLFITDAHASFIADAHISFIPDARVSFIPDARVSFIPNARVSFIPDARISFITDVRMRTPSISPRTDLVLCESHVSRLAVHAQMRLQTCTPAVNNQAKDRKQRRTWLVPFVQHYAYRLSHHLLLACTVCEDPTPELSQRLYAPRCRYHRS
jgi:hypothetical protein